MWRREMDCLLCVSDHIVELVPTWQTFPDGTRLEVTSLAVLIKLKYTLKINFCINGKILPVISRCHELSNGSKIYRPSSNRIVLISIMIRLLRPVQVQ